jgi:hypothetical protein
VPPKEPRALAEAIVEMLASPEALADARAASRARHREVFDAERMVRETVGVYRGVVAEARRSRRGEARAPWPVAAGREELDVGAPREERAMVPLN